MSMPKYQAMFYGNSATVEADNVFAAKTKALIELRVPKGESGLLSIFLAKVDKKSVGHYKECNYE